jgi:hypothetical protein
MPTEVSMSGFLPQPTTTPCQGVGVPTKKESYKTLPWTLSKAKKGLMNSKSQSNTQPKIYGEKMQVSNSRAKQSNA